MEAVQVGFLSLLPPIIAIALALATKEVISSLMVGILSGAVIYVVNIGGGVVDVFQTTFSLMGSKMADNINILLFLCILGALVAVITNAGGSKAYGVWASTKIKSKRQALLATSALGAIIFIDDYFNCLTVGTVMKPVTDKYGIHRAKLAYMIDSTAAPICIIAPISSWAAAVGSNLKDTGVFDSEMSAFMSTIPFNLYAILCLILVISLSLFDLDFGPMEKVIYEGKKNNSLGAVDLSADTHMEVSDKGTVLDLIIPIGSLIVLSTLAMMYTGGYWSGDPALHTLHAAFGNCDSALSLVLGGAGAVLIAFLLFVPRRIIGFRQFMTSLEEGVKSMVGACTILTFAWTISGVCRDLLDTGGYVGSVVEASNMPVAFIPAIIFVVAAFLSFSTGTAWGTFGILIPIVVIVAEQIAPELMVVALAATLAGSVFGDHCSPISDTTILSSTGAGCNHIQHVSTQMLYSLVVAGSCFVGYLVAGFTNGNVYLTIGSAVAVMFGILFVMHNRAKRREVA